MKKIFSILLICCASFVFADDQPVFEQTDETTENVSLYLPFACRVASEDELDDDAIDNSPSFCRLDKCDEEGCNKYLSCPCEGECEECEECEECTNCPEEKEGCTCVRHYFESDKPVFEDSEKDHNRFRTNFGSWRNYKANFGMEKIFAYFPQRPVQTYTNTTATAHAYDYGVMYSFTGFYPPMGNIDPMYWLDEVLETMDTYPYNLVSHSVYEVCGDWVMDYVVHDFVMNQIIKARAIVTPFNAYILQSVKPQGSSDYFDYFLENFYIKCECQ